MILRPRQARWVGRTLAALAQHGNTLAIAPTGAGKTVMFSVVAGTLLAEPQTKACLLAHREELVRQNRATFHRVNPILKTSLFNAIQKSWAGQAIFAMVQTLARGYPLPKLDLLVIDEAHHAVSTSYRRLIEQVLIQNPSAKILGVTATPSRSDGRGLREVFSNVADQMTVGELITDGHLVPPRTFVIDVGAQKKLSRVRRTALDFEMDEVAAILNQGPITARVIRHWQEKAGDRQTLVFCSTVAHAQSVCEAFCQAGIAAALVHSRLSFTERQKRLADYESGYVQVVVNVAVLTEGYNATRTAYIVLLRPSSHRSTWLQMIGRGLRPVDSVKHPGTVKTDCLILDFGTATRMHGALEQVVALESRPHQPGEAPMKPCPLCDEVVPLSCRQCPSCGASFEPDRVLTDFKISEIGLRAHSYFCWCDLFGRDNALMATSFHAWSGVFGLEGRWCAVGGGKTLTPRLLAIGERAVCLARAEDWLYEQEPVPSAPSARHWLNKPPTAKQLSYLPPLCRGKAGLTRYQASVHLAFQFNQDAIQRLIWRAASAD